MDTRVKRVVLSTSDIQHPFHRIVSTGILEYCAVRGYEVYVASARKNVELPQDMWWRNLIPADNIFYVDPEGDNTHPHADGIFNMLRRLYEKLSLPWHAEWTGAPLKNWNSPIGMPTWMDVLYGLRQHGILLGSDIKREMEPNHDD